MAVYMTLFETQGRIKCPLAMFSLQWLVITEEYLAISDVLFMWKE